MKQYMQRLTSIKKMKEEARAILEKEFNEAAKALFDKYPKLERFSWTQSTPSFNDGDPCYFSVHSDGASINGLDEDEFWELYNDEEYDETIKKYVKKKEVHPDAAEMNAARDEVCQLIGSVDSDDMENMFGNGSQITMYRDKETDVKDYYER